MEGVLALGTVSSIITIVDKAIDLVSEIKEVYRAETGASALHARIDGTAKELKSNCNHAKRFLDGDHDALITRANNAAEKLQNIFFELQAGPRKRDAIMKTIKSRWKRSEIEDLKDEVYECRQQLQARLIVQMAGKALAEDSGQDSRDPAATRKASLQEAANTMKHALWYPELHLREEKIVKAHDRTFQWIFEEPETGAALQWSSFRAWLESGDGIYWINGKAGSGKSTLINYVQDEERSLEALDDWSELADLVVASFFFWNSGTTLEKSLEGLYRSLISQVLEKAPQTVETMFTPQQIDDVKHLVLPAGRDTYWSEKKLASALRRLASKSTRDERYCFFIDGLDEFDGDHDLLVDALEEISSAPHIKICVSSRPLQIFIESFADSPSLRLQDLTANDVHIYVDGELRSSRKGRKFADGKPKDFQSLVKDVVDKAQGVFLWVYLVVRSLQAGLRNGDDMEELKQRIDDSPDDLLTLFSKMVASLEPRYKAQASEMFRILFAAPSFDKMAAKHSPALSILDMLLASEDNITQKALVRAPGSTNWLAVFERIQVFEQRIASTCCGLLEFTTSKGDYRGDWLEELVPQITPIIHMSPRLLHQSVHEFLTEQTAVTDFIVSPEIEDYERLLAARVSAIKLMLRSGMSNEHIHNLADYALSLALHIEKSTGHSFKLLVEEIWRTCSAYAVASPGRLTWLSSNNSTGKDIVEYITGKFDSQDAHDALVLDDIDMVAYMIVFGLYEYGSANIIEDPAIARRTDGIPLLNVPMFGHGFHAQDHIACHRWQRLVRNLLENGADPNSPWRGRSPWRRRVELQAEERAYVRLLGQIPMDLLLFVRHGADINQKIAYGGLLGPLADVEDPDETQRIFEIDESNGSYDDASAVLALEESLHVQPVHSVDPELYQILQQLVEGKIGHNLHFNLENFVSMFWKAWAAQRTMSKEGRGYDELDRWTGPGPEPIHCFPTWEISLLQWVNECLLQTEEVKSFSLLLVEKGAEMAEPRIVHIVAQRGNFASCGDTKAGRERVEGAGELQDRLAHTNQWLDEKESAVFTAAWKRTFPDYIIAGLPREIHRLLGLLNQRVDAPETVGTRGSMAVSVEAKGLLNMLASGLVPTTGLRVYGIQLAPMEEACGRILGAMEILLRFGDRLDEVGGFGGLIGLASPEELQQDACSGESQACSVM